MTSRIPAISGSARTDSTNTALLRAAALLTVACAAAFAGASASASPPVPLAKNQSITTARAKLMQAGWKPDKLNDGATDQAFVTFRSAGYTETEQCGSTEPFCVLDYNDGHGACLRVIFDYATLKPLKAWVTNWTHECVDKTMLAKPKPG
ncbi:MAG TPA: hypothetical protein VLG68_10845 [Gammaproteobacteria bacterium]|nr:hypothetical protein [Gammaproteobacteria bacterium]